MGAMLARNMVLLTRLIATARSACYYIDSCRYAHVGCHLEHEWCLFLITVSFCKLPVQSRQQLDGRTL